MEPSVSGVIILGLTHLTHSKMLHGGVRPVIRNIIDDGIPWPAIGAIDEWIVIAAVGGIKQLTKAVGTDGDIWGYKGGFVGSSSALGNSEAPAILDGFGRNCNLRDTGERRALFRKILAEGLNNFPHSLDMNRHPGRRIGNFSVDSV